MLPGSNLIITHDTQHHEAARANAAAVLDELGGNAGFVPDAPEGIFEVQVPGDPRAFIRAAADLCRRDPSRFAHTHHWRPVDLWAQAELDEMVEASRRLAAGIGPRDAWKLTLQVHGPSDLHREDLVRPLTDPIRGGRVELTNPDKEVRVDLLGTRAAFAVLARGDELSVDRVRHATKAMPQEV